MPQLDKLTFASQVFWLLISFFGLHYLLLRYILPTVAATLKYRHHLLTSVSSAREGLNSGASVDVLGLRKDIFSRSSDLFQSHITFYKTLSKNLVERLSKVIASKLFNTSVKQYWSNLMSRMEIK